MDGYTPTAAVGAYRRRRLTEHHTQVSRLDSSPATRRVDHPTFGLGRIAEGEERPKMMSVGLHCRIAGRPGKMAGLERFIRYALEHKDVWFARRIEIARHWMKTHPFTATA